MNVTSAADSVARGLHASSGDQACAEAPKLGGVRPRCLPICGGAYVALPRSSFGPVAVGSVDRAWAGPTGRLTPRNNRPDSRGSRPLANEASGVERPPQTWAEWRGGDPSPLTMLRTYGRSAIFVKLNAEAHLWRLGTKTINAWPRVRRVFAQRRDVSRGRKRRIAPTALSAADSSSIASCADSAS